MWVRHPLDNRFGFVFVLLVLSTISLNALYRNDNSVVNPQRHLSFPEISTVSIDPFLGRVGQPLDPLELGQDLCFLLLEFSFGQ
jgi:hypothetical protein